MKIAITGGMGCGKSTVINALHEHFGDEYLYGSYDSEVLRMYRHDEVFKAMLRAELGTDSKKEVAAIVFNDPAKMQWLIKATEAPLYSFLQKATSHPNVVIEVPLLFEMPGLRDMFDIAIAVWCDEETQRIRIKARDKISDDMIDRKLKMHLSNDEKALQADYVVDTSVGAVNQLDQILVIMRVAELDRP